MGKSRLVDEFLRVRGHDGVDQVARDLVVGNGFPVLHIDLAENFSIAIENHAGRFHLFEPTQIEGGGFASAQRFYRVILP